jgi:ribonuclease HI
LESFSSVNLARSDPKGKAAVSPEHQLPEGSVRLSNWTAPTEGQLKANVDAGWDVSTKKAGIGVIIRDHLGQVVECEWKFISWCASAEEAEVLACLQGLKSLIRLQAPYGILESDCLRTVKTLQCKVKDTSSCWSLYAEGQELLNLYQSISICKVDRASNGLAHGLAQLGKKGDSGSARGSVPPPLAGLAEKDCNWVDEPLAA